MKGKIEVIRNFAIEVLNLGIKKGLVSFFEVIKNEADERIIINSNWNNNEHSFGNIELPKGKKVEFKRNKLLGKYNHIDYKEYGDELFFLEIVSNINRLEEDVSYIGYKKEGKEEKVTIIFS